MPQAYANTVRQSVGPTNGVSLHGYSVDVLASLTAESPGIHRDSRLFGLELELIALRRFSEVTQRLSDVFAEHPVFVCKSDGSLPDTGFEVVTAPMTRLEAIAFVTEVAPRLRYFSKSANAAGVHIHTALPDSNILELMGHFITHASTQAWLDNVCGRAENTWCMRGRPERGSHRNALNISRHGTLEVRMFSSTLHRTRLRGYIEFVNALIEYAQVVADTAPRATSTDLLMSLTGFTTWLVAHGGYENLEKVVRNCYPTHLRSLHAVEVLTDDNEHITNPPGLLGEPRPEAATVASRGRNNEVVAQARPWAGFQTARADAPAFTYGVRNRTNRRTTAVTTSTANASQDVFLTVGSSSQLNLMRLYSVPNPTHNLGFTATTVDPGPSNQAVALWIAANSTCVGQQSATFSRASFQQWYTSFCNGSLTSNRGVLRTGQALYDHSTYHANRVLESMGYVRNARPWAGQYQFSTPLTPPLSAAGNEQNPPGSPTAAFGRCESRGGSRSFLCSLPSYHAGDHRAYRDHRNALRVVNFIESWTHEEETVVSPSSRCGVNGPQTLSSSWNCSLGTNHMGSHAAHPSHVLTTRAQVVWNTPMPTLRSDVPPPSDFEIELAQERAREQADLEAGF